MRCFKGMGRYRFCNVEAYINGQRFSSGCRFLEGARTKALKKSIPAQSLVTGRFDGDDKG